MPWKCNHHFYRLLYELHHFASKVFSSSKRNHHFFNCDWLPGCIYVYIYICMYVSTWHKLSTKRACRTPTLLKTQLIRKPLTMQHLSFDPPFLFVATGSPSQKSIMGWIDHCSTTTTRSFRIDSTKELQRSTLISWRNDLIETSQAQLQKHHSFWRKFFCFFLKNTTDAIFAEQKMTNV